MPFWWQFVRKWHQIRWKSHHFLSKCHGNAMTWTCVKFLSCLRMENKRNVDKWHGIFMEFGVNFETNQEMGWGYRNIVGLSIFTTNHDEESEILLQKLIELDLLGKLGYYWLLKLCGQAKIYDYVQNTIFATPHAPQILALFYFHTFI